MPLYFYIKHLTLDKDKKIEYYNYLVNVNIYNLNL